MSEAQKLSDQADSLAGMEFDRLCNVDTQESVEASKLDVEGVNWVHASAYVPTSISEFEQLLGALPISHEEFTFVDLGCGKGRVLLLASGRPFRKIVGVEFSEDLSRIARENVARYTGPRLCADVEVCAMDVIDYELPHEPVAVFLYHPFDEFIMAKVIHSMHRSYAACPRRIVVIYLKPVHSDLWDAGKGVVKIHASPLFSLYEIVS